MNPIVELSALTFRHTLARKPALNNLSVSIPAGQICGVIGRTGAGKSTLTALCAGFIPQFYAGKLSGTAIVDGQDVLARPVAELVRHVGLVSSNPFSQISGACFTVFEEVGFGLENIGVPRDEILERVEWALQALQLSELRDRSPYELSGGQQQRMVIAATLAMRPPVLVLDEPTAQLDPQTIEHLADLLRDLARQGTTILFAEHRLEWTASLAERILVLEQGELILDGPPDTVLNDPLLREREIGWPRPAYLADRARAIELWPAQRPLPITLDGLLDGFRAVPPDAKRAPAASSSAAEPTAPTPPTPPATGTPIVSLDGVRFSYPSGVEALRGVSLAFGAGERVALLGRNGAGKSTLVRHLNGLLQPSAGTVLVQQQDTRRTTVARCARHVGIVFQDVRNQLFARTVRDELRFGPRNLGYNARKIEELVEMALQRLQLVDVADLHPYDLSPAQRRLTAIAAVLAMDVDLLVLDEPTAGLDNPSIALLEQLGRDLVAQGKSVVVVSHDLDFCFEALDRVVLMRDGQVILDRAWNAMAAPDYALLEETVGLPVQLQAALALEDTAPPELRQLLLQRDTLM